MKKLKKEEIVSLLDRAKSSSSSYVDGKLAKERRAVVEYYRGQKPLKATASDSSYVSMDVYDAVDSMRACILETFGGHNNIVKFTPDGPHDVQSSADATDYSTHVMFRENDGFNIFYTALSDGLMARYAVAKVYPEIKQEEEVKEFSAVTGDELEVLLADNDEFDLDEIEESDSGLFSGKLRKEINKSKICVEPIPPEEFLIEDGATSIEAAKFCIHRTRKTRSELIKMGYPKRIVNKLGDNTLDNDWQEKSERHDPASTYWQSEDSYQDQTTLVDVYEFYIELDVEGRGTTKLWRMVLAGRELLEQEVVKRKPFATFVPLPVPHTFFGENFGANVIPVQNARTVLMRGILNHTVITNNPRWMVQNGALANPKELMDNRLGGIVNTRRIDGIAPLPQAPLNPFVFNAIQLLDEDKEESTGISKLSQGLNKDAVSKQNSQAMVEQMVTISQQRQKIVARQFGQFVKQLYLLVYDTARDYIDSTTIMNLSDQWVDVDPSKWEDRENVEVGLTLGYNEREREAMKIGEIHQFLKMDPSLATQYGREQQYQLLSKALELRGIPDPKAVLLPPTEENAPQPSPAEQAQLAQLQAQVQLTQSQAQAAMKKVETDFMKAQADLIAAQTEAQFKERELAIREQELQHNMVIDHAELEAAKEADDVRGILSPST